MAFPGLITTCTVDCQRTYLVVGLPDLLLQASNLIGPEKLSTLACSPFSSLPPDTGDSLDSTDPWSNINAMRCSSRQLKQKLFPSLLFELSRWYTWVNFYRHGAQSGIEGDILLAVPAIWNPCDLPGMRHCYGGDLLKELQGRKDWYASCNCAWEQLRRLLNR